MKKILLGSLLLAVGLNAMNRNGFDLYFGVGYRQDSIDWRVDFSDSNAPNKLWNHEKYPHIRMFDLSAFMDASWKGLHCQLLGDLGWFSHQSLQKNVLMALSGEESPAESASFEYLANGREASCDLRFGYQIDFNKKWAILPFTGWLNQNMALFRSNPWPPYDQISQNVPDPYVLADTSITYLSNWHQIWKGPTLGAETSYQPWKWMSVGVSYGFAWLKYKETFAEIDQALLYLPGPEAATLMSMICEKGHVRSRGHGHVVQGKVHLDFSKSWLFDVFGRYTYYYTGAAHSHSMQKSWSGNTLQSIVQPAKVDQSSFTVGCELGYRF